MPEIYGLVTGSIIGLVVSVLFEEHLVGARESLVRIIDRARLRGSLSEPAEEFHIGPLHTPLLVVEGDGEQVINEQSCRVVVDPTEVELPQEMLVWRRDIAEQQRRRRESGCQAQWNGPRYAVAGLAISRTTIDEAPEVCLRLKHADYYTFLASQQLDCRFSDGTTPRSRYLVPGAPQDAPDFMCCSFGVNVAVVTHDQQVVFARRAPVVGTRPGVWNSSANEGLSRSLDSPGRSAPNLYDVARRGVAEELSIEPGEYVLRLLAFAIDTELSQWAALFIAVTYDLTGRAVLDRRSRGVPDKWENETIELESFDVESVTRSILRADRRDNWAPTAPALFYLALVNTYGRRRVERQIARVLRDISRDADGKEV